ncbi:MAG: protein-L-isoaspartate O-methyltransferase [Oligoflexia bacterium]|nr:protein-L-isoaspartate O-methyltransferase [Oligoflexia bacterium]
MAIPLTHSISEPWSRFAEQIVNSAGIADDDVAANLVAAFSVVARERFVETNFSLRAGEDSTLPAGFDTNCIKPSVLARMLGLIGLRRGMRVLELNCSSGYGSAVMSAAGAQVFALDPVGLLAQRTRKLLDGLYFQNVLVRRGDSRGWPEYGPYDAIVINAPVSGVETELLAQLTTPGGRLVALVGNHESQVVTLWEQRADGVMSYQLETVNIFDSEHSAS